MLLVSAARLASLATGRGGLPAADEWPMVGLVMLAFAFLGARVLRSLGLTKVESCTLAIGGPVLVVFDAPLGQLGPNMALAANLAGCILPVAIGLKVLIDRRVPALETFVMLGLAVVVAFLGSRVVPDRGVLLSYRVPALVIGVVGAALFHRRPEVAGALSFAAGGIGVLLGADILHLRELASGGESGRVILGGAGLFDGILLVAMLSGAVAACLATLARMATGTKRAAGGAA